MLRYKSGKEVLKIVNADINTCYNPAIILEGMNSTEIGTYSHKHTYQNIHNGSIFILKAEITQISVSSRMDS